MSITEFKNLKIKNIDCVLQFTPQQRKFSSGKRVNHIVGIQLTGMAMHYMKSRNVMLDSQTIYFFNQKDSYDVDVFEAGISYSVHFTTYEPIETESFFIHVANTSEVLRLLDALNQSMAYTGNELKTTAIFYNLCALIYRIYEKNYFSGDLRIKNAEKYICEHFKEPNCINLAADSCNLSRRRFNDLFKHSFHVSPTKYIIHLKISTAKRYLTASNAEVSHIAELCGISDIYYFSKLFKRETGYTPSEYRKVVKKDILWQFSTEKAAQDNEKKPKL